MERRWFPKAGLQSRKSKCLLISSAEQKNTEVWTYGSASRWKKISLEKRLIIKSNLYLHWKSFPVTLAIQMYVLHSVLPNYPDIRCGARYWTRTAEYDPRLRRVHLRGHFSKANILDRKPGVVSWRQECPYEGVRLATWRNRIPTKTRVQGSQYAWE